MMHIAVMALPQMRSSHGEGTLGSALGQAIPPPSGRSLQGHIGLLGAAFDPNQASLVDVQLR